MNGEAGEVLWYAQHVRLACTVLASAACCFMVLVVQGACNSTQHALHSSWQGQGNRGSCILGMPSVTTHATSTANGCYVRYDTTTVAPPVWGPWPAVHESSTWNVRQPGTASCITGVLCSKAPEISLAACVHLPCTAARCGARAAVLHTFCATDAWLKGVHNQMLRGCGSGVCLIWSGLHTAAPQAATHHIVDSMCPCYPCACGTFLKPNSPRASGNGIVLFTLQLHPICWWLLYQRHTCARVCIVIGGVISPCWPHPADI